VPRTIGITLRLDLWGRRRGAGSGIRIHHLYLQTWALYRSRFLAHEQRL